MRCIIAVFFSAFLLMMQNPASANEGKGGSSQIPPAITQGATFTDDKETLASNISDQSRLGETFGKLPLFFIENQGQLDEKVAYYQQGIAHSLFFTADGITYTFKGEENDSIKRWALKLDFVNANREVKVRGDDRQKTCFSYFKGRPEEWLRGVPTYQRLVYADLWSGIDLVYTGEVNRLKYEYVVKPGADPGQIRLAYRGVDKIEITDSGALAISTPLGCFEDGKPYAYQVIEGRKVEIDMAYALEEEVPGETNAYHFKVGAYDPQIPLILDPYMAYCGYIGGENGAYGNSIAIDSEGNAYVTGQTSAMESSFPVVVGPDLTYNGFADCFIAKVNASGTHLDYCGYIGGEGIDIGFDIAVDNAGNAYVAGFVQSLEIGFPTVVGPDLTFNGGPTDTFVAKVNSDGTGLDYCGFIGGDGYEGFYGYMQITVDSAGNAYVLDSTDSTESTFPVVVGPDLTYNDSGFRDAYVAKVNAAGTHLDYCGYIGGEGSDTGAGIAVDSAGCVYLAGFTGSTQSSFPVVVGPDLTHNGGFDCFVAKLNATGTEYDYCGYIGGTSSDRAYDITIDSTGNAYLTGVTFSSESSFPDVAGPDQTYNGGEDVFVAKVNPTGTGLDYCGYIGGVGEDVGYGIGVDGDGNAYVIGATGSSESSFPVVEGPDLTFNGGTFDAFVAKVNPMGTALAYCSYLGGSDWERGYGIAVNEHGRAYVVGATKSTEATFPVRIGPDITHNSSADAFVAKICFPPIYVDGDNTTGPWEGSRTQPFRNIQDGIDVAIDEDTVLVMPGTYFENLNFQGKAITVRSDGDGDPVTEDCSPENVIIDGNQLGTVVTFENNEGLDSILEGFTITNGTASRGGGVFCLHGSPTIINNIITNNTASSNSGGGFYAAFSSAVVTLNTISENTAFYNGGGIYCASNCVISENLITGNASGAYYMGGGIFCNDCDPIIKNNIISDNFAHKGGGINLRSDCSAVIQNNIISENTATEWGGGIVCYAQSGPTSRVKIINNTIIGNSAEKGGGIMDSLNHIPTVINTIVWGNTADEGPEIYGNPTVTYCNIQGGFPGTGNIDMDPVFLDPGSDDYHLSSVSPCIDVGDNHAIFLPDVDMDGQSRIMWGTRVYPLMDPLPKVRVDIGADEFRPRPFPRDIKQQKITF